MFSKMIRFLVLLLCCLVGAQAKCFYGPVGKLPEGCEVRNLTVTPYHSQEIIDRLKCNITADAGFFNNSPQYVGFQQIWGNIAPAYLLTVVDRTTNNALWIMSNLTMTTYRNIYPSSNAQYAKTIIPWKKPYFNPNAYHHVLEFLVFEEYRDHPSRMFYNYSALYTPPFNLSTWINNQQNSGIKICGPVAGGNVVAFQQSPPHPIPPPRPTSAPHPIPPSRPTSSPHHRNNSNRNSFDAILLAGVLFAFKVLAF